MTRLTQSHRHNIQVAIMGSLPTENFIGQLQGIVQEALLGVMPAEVRAVYDDEGLREKYLNRGQVDVRVGNRTLYQMRGEYFEGSRCHVYGYPVLGAADRYGELTLCFTEAFDDTTRPRRESPAQAVWDAVHKSGLVKRWLETNDRMVSTSKRLRTNLAAASSFKRLREILEPELHRFIPNESVRETHLPAVVAPVVDDLRELGLELAEVPTAEGEVAKKAGKRNPRR